MSSRPELRLVLAVSLDGRLAAAAGGAAQIGGEADRRVLEEALAWADGCLIGAETLRLHGSTCLIHAPHLLAARQGAGRPLQPIAIAVSRGGELPAALPFFRQPLQRWLLHGPAAPERPGFARRFPLASWGEALLELAAAGVERLVVLGGARLAGSLLAEDLIDGLQLTLCPCLLGGAHTWLPLAGPSFPHDPAAQPPWQLMEQRPLAGGELLLRYRRASKTAAACPVR
ncbi:MAG: dihydrofolate reductase family protein [Prochlorococcaceae cyanobacterium]